VSRSTNTTVTVRVPTRHELIAQEASSLSSHWLAELAKPMPTPSTTAVDLVGPSVLRTLTVRDAAIACDPVATMALAQIAPDLLATSREMLDASHDALTQGNVAMATLLAREGDEALRGAVQATAEWLAHEERVSAAAVVEEALRSIGCRTLVAEFGGRNGIWAERDHQIMAVLIEDGGQAVFDIAGCDAGECLPLHRELEQALAQHGATLDDQQTFEHGPGGGTLIQRATAIADTSTMMADAIVRQAAGAPSRGTTRSRGQRAASPQPQSVRGG
jgi:hypothetical protein